MTTNPSHEKTPRVLLVCGVFSPERCGVGDYTRRLASELGTQGADVHVWSSKGAVESEGVHVHADVDGWTDTLLVRRRFEEVLREVRPDVVQIQYPGSYGKANRSVAGNLLPHWARTRGFRVFTTLHEWGERSLLWRLRASLMVSRSHGVVAVTSPDARILARRPRLGSARVRHIPLGPNLEFDRIQQARSAIPVLAFFGFLDPLKGLEELLEVAASLRVRGQAFRLDLHGRYEPASCAHHAAIRAQVQRLGLDGVVRFAGPLPGDPQEAARALSETWLGVLPFREGISERRSSFLVLGRAGIPVLTSPGRWQPDWLEDSENVFLEPLSPEGWADRIARLCEDPARLDGVGSRLRSEILGRHDWAFAARGHLDFWKGPA